MSQSPPHIAVNASLRKKDCLNMLRGAGIAPSAIYALGYPNANCIGCVKATSPAYWRLVRDTFPTVFAQRAEQSRELGARLVRVKGERVFLDEMPPDSDGQLEMNFDCGVFCDGEKA